jgi:hypothetical protein
MDAAKTYLGDRTRMQTIIKYYNLIREDVNEMLAVNERYRTEKSKNRRLTKVREPQAPIQSMYKPNEPRDQSFLIIRTRTLRHLADLPDDDARTAYKATQEYKTYAKSRTNECMEFPVQGKREKGRWREGMENKLEREDKTTREHYKTHKVSDKVVGAFNREVAEEMDDLKVLMRSFSDQLYYYEKQRQAAAKDVFDDGSPAESKRKVPAALRPRKASSSKPSRKAPSTASSAKSMRTTLSDQLAPQGTRYKVESTPCALFGCFVCFVLFWFGLVCFFILFVRLIACPSFAYFFVCGWSDSVGWCCLVCLADSPVRPTSKRSQRRSSNSWPCLSSSSGAQLLKARVYCVSMSLYAPGRLCTQERCFSS